MRVSILGFNQAKAVELKLTTNDLLLLQYIMYANSEPSMKHIVEDEIAYVWLQHNKIQEDLPILNITDGTLRNKLTEFKNKGLITSKVVANTSGRGSRAYYTITELTTSLINDTVEGPHHSKMTSNIELNGDKEDSISINTNTTQTEDDFSSKSYSKEELRDEFLGSVKKSNRRRNVVKRPTLFDKCVAEIDVYTDKPELRNKLIQFLRIRLEVKDKPLGLASWQGMLEKLDQAVAECGREYVDVVQQSIDKGWLSFYPIDNKQRGKQSNFDYVPISLEVSADYDIEGDNHIKSHNKKGEKPSGKSF